MAAIKAVTGCRHAPRLPSRPLQIRIHRDADHERWQRRGDVVPKRIVRELQQRSFVFRRRGFDRRGEAGSRPYRARAGEPLDEVTAKRPRGLAMLWELFPLLRSPPFPVSTRPSVSAPSNRLARPVRRAGPRAASAVAPLSQGVASQTGRWRSAVARLDTSPLTVGPRVFRGSGSLGFSRHTIRPSPAFRIARNQ